jgi:hypothetical protein
LPAVLSHHLSGVINKATPVREDCNFPLWKKPHNIFPLLEKWIKGDFKAPLTIQLWGDTYFSEIMGHEVGRG